MIHTATVNKTFRELLLTDAAKAIEQGYKGEPFNLTPDTREFILSIRASTVQEFAQKIVDWQSQFPDESNDQHPAYPDDMTFLL